LNVILNSEYLYYFAFHYKSNKKIHLKIGEINYEFELVKNVKLFNDLFEKDKKGKKYIIGLILIFLINFVDD